MISGVQFIIVFRADDLKLSQKDEENVSDITAKLGLIYATINPKTMHRGKLHHYLEITMEF